MEGARGAERENKLALTFKVSTSPSGGAASVCTVCPGDVKECIYSRATRRSGLRRRNSANLMTFAVRAAVT